MSNQQYIIETPATHPHHVFETRTFYSPESPISYCVTLAKMYWKLFDRFTLTQEKKNCAISECSELFIKYGKKEDRSFSDVLHYWILCQHRRVIGKFYASHFNYHAELH